MKTRIFIVISLLLLVGICFATWDNDKPADTSLWNNAAGEIRDNWDALEDRFGVDLDNNVINVTGPTYGATGDGTTDDTTAIQAALDALDSTYGGTVIFPAGRYYITSALTSTKKNVVIRGMSGVGAQETDKSGVEIVSDQAIYLLDLGNTSHNRHGTIVENIAFADISTSYNQVLAGIRVRSMERVKIRDCHFYNMRVGKGIYGDGTDNTLIDWTISDIRSYDVKQGIYLDKASHVNITNGQIVGDDIASGAAVYLDNCASVNIVGLAIDNCVTGVGLYGSTTKTSACYIRARFEGCTLYGIHNDNGYNNTFAFCQFSGNDFVPTGAGIPIQIDSHTNNYDLWILAPNFAGVSASNIVNSSTKRVHVFDYGGLQQLHVDFTAQDATPSVTPFTNFFKTNNGSATTITDFDDGRMGQKITLVIDDTNTTIDFSGTNLKGNGGADWKPSRYDWMEAKYDGTYWYCNIFETSSNIRTLADDATPSILGTNTWLTGGTTTITDFDDGVTGQIITIIAEHSLDITDGTNIFLSGSANWSMTATDTLTLICKADNKWYEVGRGDNGA